MEGAYANVARNNKSKRVERKVAEAQADYHSMTPDQATKQLKKLQDKMFQHAKNLEFEQAAAIRDQMAQIRAQVFGLD